MEVNQPRTGNNVLSGKIGRHLFKAQSDDSGMAMAMAYLKLIVEGPYIIEFYTNKKLLHLIKKKCSFRASWVCESLF